MDRLGHSTIRVTYDRYGHLLDGDDDELVAKLEERCNAASGNGSRAPCPISVPWKH
jgi:hypothetical protein